MKLKVTLAVLLVAAVAIVGACYNDYHANRISVAKAKQTVQRADAAVTAAQAANDRLVAKYNTLWAECQKGFYDYSFVPAASKNVNNLPNCGLSILQ